MPTMPPRACHVCRRLGCTDPAHKAKPRGERRTPRPYDYVERTLHASMIARHVERYGWMCPGAPELDHKPHAVKPGQLDVDDIVPVVRGGDRRDPRNKRVLCRRVNRGRRW